MDTGSYTGSLVGQTGSYSTPILLSNEDVKTDDLYLIHPNEFTNETKVENWQAQGMHTGPWNYPLSQGCQTVEGLDEYNKMVDTLEGVGYDFDGYIGTDENGEYIPINADTIEVTIKDEEC